MMRQILSRANKTLPSVVTRRVPPHRPFSSGLFPSPHVSELRSHPRPAVSSTEDILPRGFLSLSALEQEVSAGGIDTVALLFTDLHGRPLGKSLDARYFLDKGIGGSHACSYLLTSSMAMDPLPGMAFANHAQGYGDVELVPDLTTLRRMSWRAGTAVVLCDIARGGVPVPVSPRTMLKTQLERARELGFGVVAATELEYYLFDAHPHALALGSTSNAMTEQTLRSLAAGGDSQDYHLLAAGATERLSREMRWHLNASGVPVEGSKGEAGPGQWELNTRYGEALAAADGTVVYKMCVKDVAREAGKTASFMAKPFTKHAGSGCHLHLNLTSLPHNTVSGAKHTADASATTATSTNAFSSSPTVLSHFLSGLSHHSPALMPLFAPSPNSYKRVAAAAWAPAAAGWAEDARTAAFRVVGSGMSRRVEVRLPGADANPYLALAGALAAGLDGVAREGRYAPEGNWARAGPGSEDGSSGECEGEALPKTLRDALGRWRGSEFPAAAFGTVVAEHIAQVCEGEAAAAELAVTDWERSRYLEQA